MEGELEGLNADDQGLGIPSSSTSSKCNGSVSVLGWTEADDEPEVFGPDKSGPNVTGAGATNLLRFDFRRTIEY